MKKREDVRRKVTAANETLFVVNFDPDQCRERDLERHFGEYGRLRRVQVWLALALCLLGGGTCCTLGSAGTCVVWGDLPCKPLLGVWVPAQRAGAAFFWWLCACFAPELCAAWQLALVLRNSSYSWDQGNFVCLGRCLTWSVALHMWGQPELSLIFFPQHGAFWVLAQLSTGWCACRSRGTMALCNTRKWRTPPRRCGPATTAASWVSEVWPLACGTGWRII